MARRSSKAAMMRLRLTWLRPKERTPGVSITQEFGRVRQLGARWPRTKCAGRAQSPR